MPVLTAVTIFASLYGGAAILSGLNLLNNTPPATGLTVEMNGGRARMIRSRSSVNHQRRKKSQSKKPRSRWYQFWRKPKKQSSVGENGVSEPPSPSPAPPRRRTPPVRPPRPASVDLPGSLLGSQLDQHFDGFTGEYLPTSSSSESCLNTVSFVFADPVPLPRLRRMPRKSRLRSTPEPQPNPPPKQDKPTVQPNVQSFSKDYELIRTFGNISQGAVHLVKHRISSQRFIIKQTLAPFNSETGEIEAPAEASVFFEEGGIHTHKNILRFVDCFTYFDGIIPMANIVFEYCDAGDVTDLMEIWQQRQQSVPEMFVLHFISSMIDALAFLHCGDVWYDVETDTTASIRHRQTAYLHRDIKPMNIFMKWAPGSDFGMPTIVLGDFGFAQPEATTSSAPHTPGYVAPELQEIIDSRRSKPNSHTAATDMYAFGVSVWELITNKAYISGYTDIREGFLESSVSEYPCILNLLEKCLSETKTERPRANELHSLCAELKAKLQAWYESGERLPADTWTASPQPQQTSGEQTATARARSSCYTGDGMPPGSLSRGRPRTPQRRGESRHCAEKTADKSPTIALFPIDIDSRCMRPASTPDTSEGLINLFTGEPADEIEADNADVFSTLAEAGNLGDHDIVSAFSDSTSDDGSASSLGSTWSVLSP